MVILAYEPFLINRTWMNFKKCLNLLVDNENIDLETKFINFAWTVNFLQNLNIALRAFFKKVWLVAKNQPFKIEHQI